jgi:hypothetical protein
VTYDLRREHGSCGCVIASETQKSAWFGGGERGMCLDKLHAQLNLLTARESLENHDNLLTVYSVAFARSMEVSKRHGDEAHAHMCSCYRISGRRLTYPTRQGTEIAVIMRNNLKVRFCWRSGQHPRHRGAALQGCWFKPTKQSHEMVGWLHKAHRPQLPISSPVHKPSVITTFTHMQWDCSCGTLRRSSGQSPHERPL